MGNRDMGHKETKKPKKGCKRPSVGGMIVPTPEVEVIKKKKRVDSDN
ncbi:MAG: hypothetical protein FWH42_00780 [Dehalococcoidia bacterium]|nr:hypothetical protein [Dehalococcoidia bacterium]